MKTKIIISALTSVVFLSGCSGNIKPEAVKAANGSSVDIISLSAMPELNNNLYADHRLREVTTAHNTMQKSLAVLSVLTGSFDSRSFDKDNYKGTSIESLKNPTNDYFVPKAKENISQWLSDNANGYVYKEPLYIGYATWALIFKDAAASDPDYQLKYKVIFYKRPEDGSLFSKFILAGCTPAPIEAKLSEWHVENYKKVTVETQKYMDSCLLELNNQLPRLLKK
ncbi:hypothetical protein [Winslowiella toletana]|uniref:hypothetical protein n=1 Tax=Winslowiella toletana TaxID=92490 RepID=UPI0028BEC260|nr:hypothetical protein [Winslowiella toletana]WNN44902.1 hypothetical protein RIN69_03030 [Winslowiella toletana]